MSDSVPGEDTSLRVAQVITRMIVGGAQENTFLTTRDLKTIGGPSLPRTLSVETTLLAGNETGPEGSLWDEVLAASLRTERVDSMVRALDPGQDWRAYRHLRARFVSGDFDVVHTHSSKAGILGRRAAARAGVPAVIHTVHGWPFHPGQPAAIRRGYVAIERRAARWADALVAVSEDDIETGLRHRIGVREQYELIRSGIELERYANPSRSREEMRRELGLPLDAPVVGSITRLSPQKAPLDLIEFFYEVGRHLPQARFLLVGDGPLQNEVAARIEARGLSDRLVLVPGRRDVPELLTALDLFALTSRWEGLPRTIPESLTAGVPVVALGVSGIRDLLVTGETGILRGPGEIVELGQDVAKLLLQPQIRARMGQQGRQRAASFGVEEMVARLSDLYGRILLRKGWFGKLDRVCSDP